MNHFPLIVSSKEKKDKYNSQRIIKEYTGIYVPLFTFNGYNYPFIQTGK